MPIITIDGNIGAGKTTILNYLHTNLNMNVDLEPVDKWKSYLDNIYLHKKDYFNFQVRVWLDRSWIQEKNKYSSLIMERSPLFIRNTFNKYINNNHLITPQEFHIINELYDKTDIIWSSNYYIYIRSSPIKCHERILSRGRPNELSISLEYLKEIHDLHEETYKKALEDELNIICIDIEDKSIEEIATLILDYVKHL
jgi:deoxyadenosine/deoxycytidine kinase